MMPFQWKCKGCGYLLLEDKYPIFFAFKKGIFHKWKKNRENVERREIRNYLDYIKDRIGKHCGNCGRTLDARPKVNVFPDPENPANKRILKNV